MRGHQGPPPGLMGKKGRKWLLRGLLRFNQSGGAQRPHLKMMFLNEFDKILKIAKEVDSIKI